jgi:hypothetical protein
MRIYGSNGAPAAAPASTARRSGSTDFVLPRGGSAAGPSAAAAVRTVSGIDALIALQGVDDPAERRRRSIGRGRNALDTLDELKLGLLAGAVDQRAIGRLQAVVAGLKEGSGDPNLDDVLDAISLRVEVELAKMGRATGI